MMNTQTATMLAYYKAWADKVIFEGVAALPPGEAENERKTLFKTIIGTLNHTYVVDLIWQAHLEGREHGFKARSGLQHSELPALWAAQQKNERLDHRLGRSAERRVARRGRTLHLRQRRQS